MVAQYDAFVWNGTPETCPDLLATPEEMRVLWGAEKLFLDCTETEAINQYSLVGFRPDGIPDVIKTDPSTLKGVTKLYAISKTVSVYDANNEVIHSEDNCIPVPDNIESYDLSEFTYEIIDIDFPE
jgi:hypothetical protein